MREETGTGEVGQGTRGWGTGEETRDRGPGEGTGNVGLGVGEDTGDRGHGAG